MSALIDLTGQKFNRLTVIKRAENGKKGQPRWSCLCDCGNTTVVFGADLRCGHTNSCGCYKIEQTRKHGMWRTPEYSAWDTMRRRCYKPDSKDFKNYGGRGISVCNEWMESFDAFFEYVGHKPSPLHSLDRIDNNGNYEPGNVRWANFITQNNNNRHNHRLTVNGITLNITQWAKRNNINRGTLYSRIRLGWSPERAVSQPVAK